MQTSLPQDLLQALDVRLQAANQERPPRGPAGSGRRQPVHTVYGGAHLFAHDTARKLGALALRALEQDAPDALGFAQAIELPAWPMRLTQTLYDRVRAKLAREPVEDLRIDFEDGYGWRPDEEEDGHAVRAAREAARGLREGTLPPGLGVRIKSFSDRGRARGLRTLDLFLTALVGETGGQLPAQLVVTLPKVSHPEQAAVLAELCELFEERLALPPGALHLELMIETPQAILDPQGRAALPALVAAARGRCAGVHLGAYDYTAALEITAAHQRLDHPACDFARQVMQVSLAGSGVWIADGATTVLPIGPNRDAGGGPPASPHHLLENRQVVHRAWRLHAANVRRALVQGIYQGWDLHPAQLPARYGAVYAFFLENLERAAARLRSFLDKAAQASRLGDVFDDAATGEGLLNFFRRGLACGALTEEDLLASGLQPGEVSSPGRSSSRTG